jgi:hypothetical protein
VETPVIPTEVSDLSGLIFDPGLASLANSEKWLPAAAGLDMTKSADFVQLLARYKTVSAKGAAFILAWGSVPGMFACER